MHPDACNTPQSSYEYRNAAPISTDSSHQDCVQRLQNPCAPTKTGMPHSSSQLPAAATDGNYTLLATAMAQRGSRSYNDKSDFLRCNAHESHKRLPLSTAQPPTWVTLHS